MKIKDSLEAFEKWATAQGLNIETSASQLDDGTIVYGYVDHGTGMACEGWLAREDHDLEKDDER